MNARTCGFTLIEVLLYIALFSILIGGAVVCAFDLLETALNGGTRTMLAQETDFLLAKVSWELNDASEIALPATGAVRITHAHDTQNDPVVFLHTGTDLTLARHGESAVPLNNSNVKVEVATFALGSSADPESPSKVETVFTLSARTPNGLVLTRIATSTVYVRK